MANAMGTSPQGEGGRRRLSCPIIGVPQLIITHGEANGLTNCGCEPPLGYLLDYLKNDQDTYLPSLEKCMDSDGDIKSKKSCKV